MSFGRRQTVHGVIYREVAAGEREIIIEGEFYPAENGATDAYGAPLEPDTPESIEITSARIAGSDNEIELTEDEERRAEENLWDALD